MVNNKKDGGYDFVIKVIQYLENTFGIRFFITPKDFDVVYRWYEKRIPIHIVKESMANVVERRTQKNKKISGFSNFYYQVKKNFETFLQLSVGAESEAPQVDSKVDENPFEEIENFFKNYPEELISLKEDFETLSRQIKNKENVDPAPVYKKLADLFAEDEEINLKVTIFTRSLAPELRKPEIKNRYRINYLINKYHIPDFEILI
jgi:hypothetical protein